MGRYPDLLQHPSLSECKVSIVGRAMKEVVRETSIRRSDGHARTEYFEQTCIHAKPACWLFLDAHAEITPEFILVCYIQPPTGASDLDLLTFTGHISSNFFLDRAWVSVVGLVSNLSEEGDSPILPVPRGKT